MIRGIDVVFIHSKEPKKLSKWYRDILEMEVEFQTPDYSWQEFQIPVNSPPTRFAIDFPGENVSGPSLQTIMISFRVDDIYTVINKLEKKGITFNEKKKVQDTGKTLFATFKDPEDNWIQISQRKQGET